MSIQTPQKRLIIRWTTLKGVVAIILFMVVAALVEYFVVLHAINLGVKDETQLQWSFKFPGTEWTLAVVISPLFHLVPVAVIISLVFSWIYLTKHVAVKPIETQKWRAETATKRGQNQRLKAIRNFVRRIKSGLLKVKGIAFLWQKIHFARATIKSALTLIMVFLAFIIILSILTYPQLIYQTIGGVYKANPSLLDVVKGTAQFFASVGGIFSAINSALLAAAPSFRDFVLTIGLIIKPLADLDDAGKYLVFQNAASWISAVAALFYGEYRRKVYRYKKTRRG